MNVTSALLATKITGKYVENYRQHAEAEKLQRGANNTGELVREGNMDQTGNK